jgi:hypothetical protein
MLLLPFPFSAARRALIPISATYRLSLQRLVSQQGYSLANDVGTLHKLPFYFITQSNDTVRVLLS